MSRKYFLISLCLLALTACSDPPQNQNSDLMPSGGEQTSPPPGYEQWCIDNPHDTGCPA